MLSFTSSLSPDCEAFAIFITEKYDYKGKKDILPNNVVQKINSFLDVLKAKKKDEELNSFDISNHIKGIDKINSLFIFYGHNNDNFKIGKGQ